MNVQCIRSDEYLQPSIEGDYALVLYPNLGRVWHIKRNGEWMALCEKDVPKDIQLIALLGGARCSFSQDTNISSSTVPTTTA